MVSQTTLLTRQKTFTTLEAIANNGDLALVNELTELLWFGGVVSYGNIMRETYAILYGWISELDLPDLEGLYLRRRRWADFSKPFYLFVTRCKSEAYTGAHCTSIQEDGQRSTNHATRWYGRLLREVKPHPHRHEEAERNCF